MSPSPATPPIAPSIALQQAPLAQYAQSLSGNAAGTGGGPGNEQQQMQTSLGMAQSMLTGIGNEMERLAKIIVVVKPELVPILKQGAQALGMLMNEITKDLSPDNGAATQAQAMPDSGAVSAA